MTTRSTSGGPRPSVLADAHEHGWMVESAHGTSQGSVLYVRCAECGSRRVDLQDRAGRPPAALSGVVLKERART